MPSRITEPRSCYREVSTHAATGHRRLSRPRPEPEGGRADRRRRRPTRAPRPTRTTTSWRAPATTRAFRDINVRLHTMDRERIDMQAVSPAPNYAYWADEELLRPDRHRLQRARRRDLRHQPGPLRRALPRLAPVPGARGAAARHGHDARSGCAASRSARAPRTWIWTIRRSTRSGRRPQRAQRPDLHPPGRDHPRQARREVLPGQHHREPARHDHRPDQPDLRRRAGALPDCSTWWRRTAAATCRRTSRGRSTGIEVRPEMQTIPRPPHEYLRRIWSRQPGVRAAVRRRT